MGAQLGGFLYGDLNRFGKPVMPIFEEIPFDLMADLAPAKGEEPITLRTE